MPNKRQKPIQFNVFEHKEMADVLNEWLNKNERYTKNNRVMLRSYKYVESALMKLEGNKKCPHCKRYFKEE
jgi:hypothetical protein